jgi:hypothetical protein
MSQWFRNKLTRAFSPRQGDANAESDSDADVDLVSQESFQGLPEGAGAARRHTTGQTQILQSFQQPTMAAEGGEARRGGHHGQAVRGSGVGRRHTGGGGDNPYSESALERAQLHYETEVTV